MRLPRSLPLDDAAPTLTLWRYHCRQDAFLPPLVAQLEQRQSLAASHLAATASVSLLSALVSFHSTTSALASATTAGALPTAIEELARVSSAVEEGAEEWIEHTDAWKALVRWASDEESRLEAALQGALEGCFDVSPASTAGGVATLTLRERIAAAPNGPELAVRDLLQGLEDLAGITGRPAQTEKFLARLAKQVLRHFVAPFLEAHGAVKVGASGAQATAVAQKARVAFRFRDDGALHVVELAPAEEQVDAVEGLSAFLAFFTSHSSLFHAAGSADKPSRHAATLAAHLTPSLQSHVISSHLSPSLPASTSDLPAYLALVSAASNFESTFLPSHGLFAFLPSSLSSSSREVEEQRVIRTWAARVPQHWARQVGDRALARVRGAVKAWDWGAGETVEVEVREEEEMLGLLLGLGLADEQTAAAEPNAPRVPRELALQTVPRGAQCEMTIEEALAPKILRARTPPPPAAPPAPAPAPVEERAPSPPPAAPPSKGTLKRGKLGAARIAAPLPPRSPSPPPLFQGEDAPAPTPAPGPAEASPAPEPHELDRATVISPTLSPRGQHTTFELLEDPAATLDGIETTADHAGEGEVGAVHSYEAEVKDEPGESPLEAERAQREEEKVDARVKVEEEEEDSLAPTRGSDGARPSSAHRDDGDEADVKPRVIKEESVEPEIPPTPSPGLAAPGPSHSPSLGLTYDEPSPSPSPSHEDAAPPPANERVVKEEEQAEEQAGAPVLRSEAVDDTSTVDGEASRDPQPYEASPYKPSPYEPSPYAPSSYEPSPQDDELPKPAPYDGESAPYGNHEMTPRVEQGPSEEDPDRAREAPAVEDEAQDPYRPSADHDPCAPVDAEQGGYSGEYASEQTYAPLEAASTEDQRFDESRDPYGPTEPPSRNAQGADAFYGAEAEDPYGESEAYGAPSDPYAASAHGDGHGVDLANEDEADPYAPAADARDLSAPAAAAATDDFEDPYADEADVDWYAQEEQHDWYAQEDQAYSPLDQPQPSYQPEAGEGPHASNEAAEATYQPAHDSHQVAHNAWTPAAPAHDPYAPVDSNADPYTPHSYQSAQHEVRIVPY